MQPTFKQVPPNVPRDSMQAVYKDISIMRTRINIQTEDLSPLSQAEQP